MTTISIANQKGGVGKTTTAIALSTALTRRGKRVMVIDTDFPESDRYTGLRCHAFVTIKRHISDNRKPLSLLGKIVYCCFGIRSPLRPRLQRIYATSLSISTSEFQFL